MGFNWEKYESGGDYITAAEKKALAESGAPFGITGVIERESRFEHDAEFLLRLDVPDGIDGVEGGERALTFAKGSGADSRDAMLSGMVDYFDNPEADDIQAKLEKFGRAYLLKAAS